MPKNIQLIIGSVREGRSADQIAEWVKQQSAKNENVVLHVTDVKELDFPMFAEAVAPAYGTSDKDFVQNWSRTVKEADGFIFVTPEYNRSIPSGLKNAIDYLAAEWEGKPSMIVSYGWVDGGASAARHLTDILAWLKLNQVTTQVALPLSAEIMNEQRAIADPTTAFSEQEKAFADALQELVS